MASQACGCTHVFVELETVLEEELVELLGRYSSRKRDVSSPRRLPAWTGLRRTVLPPEPPEELDAVHGDGRHGCRAVAAERRMWCRLFDGASGRGRLEESTLVVGESSKLPCAFYELVRAGQRVVRRSSWSSQFREKVVRPSTSSGKAFVLSWTIKVVRAGTSVARHAI